MISLFVAKLNTIFTPSFCNGFGNTFSAATVYRFFPAAAFFCAAFLLLPFPQYSFLKVGCAQLCAVGMLFVLLLKFLTLKNQLSK